MRFPKKTREAIQAAQGRPVEIDWPASGPEPRANQTYTVQSSHRAGVLRVLVLFIDGDGERVVVRVDADPVRLLGKSGGYSTAPAGAMSIRKGVEPAPMGGPQFRSEVEPEAVSERDQLAITRAAHEKQREVVREQIEKLEGVIAETQAMPEFEHVKADLRFAQSLVRKSEAKLLSYQAAVA